MSLQSQYDLEREQDRLAERLEQVPKDSNRSWPTARPQQPESALNQASGTTNAQWRICFRWTDDGPWDVEIADYH